MALDEVLEHHGRSFFMCPEVRFHSLRFLETANEVIVEDMAKGTVAEIMHQTSDCHITHLSIANIEVRLSFAKGFDLLLSQIGDSNAVLKSLMAA